ncbi:MAG: FkbM family methyltransferase [Ferruginibacter sp.]
MVFIKKILYRTLSQRSYLKLLNTSFLLLYKTGLLKSQEAYRYHYFAKNLISKGDTVLDIGANLGYYSNLFIKWIGPRGKLYSVEPVKPFQEILHWKLDKYPNVIIFPYALGNEEKKITLVIPVGHAYLKTGLPHVLEEKESGQIESYQHSFDAEMKIPSKLFASVGQVNFIKCDIEGYEEYVLPEMKGIIETYLPIVQVETWGTHKKAVDELFSSLGYNQYQLQDNKLVLFKNLSASQGDDYIFIHQGNEKAMSKVKKLF